jgi:hypothetical protein
MAAGSRTRLNGLPVPLTIPRPGEPGRRHFSPAAGSPAADRASGRWPRADRPVAGEPVPRRLPRLLGACRAAARATARPPGSAPARAHRAGSARPPQSRAASAVSPARAGTASTRKAQTFPAPRPAPRVKAKRLADHRRAAAGHGQDQRKSNPGYTGGTRKVQERSTPGTPDFRNKRLILPLWHLIPGQKMKNGLKNRISVDEGSSAPARPGGTPSSPTARWPPAESGPAVRSGGNQA